MSDAIQTFQAILQEKGLIPSELITDGTLQRCPTSTKPHKRNGAYIIHQDIPAVLWWCNWETGDQGTATDAPSDQFAPQEKEALSRRMEAMKAQRDKERLARHAEAAQKAADIFAASPPCTEHPYLAAKGITALGDIRSGRGDELLLPVLSSKGTVQSIQRVFPDGTKRFLTGGKVEGGSFLIPGDANKPLIICEGYATGASIHLAGGYPVLVAFSANNLPAVAAQARSRYPHRAIIICGDADETGQRKAREAATAAQAHLAIPDLAGKDGKDFNDLHQSAGLAGVRRQMEAAEQQLAQAHASLVALDMGTFLTLPLTERGYLLTPVLPRQGIVILYAARGIGKTFMALSMGLAVASGGTVLRWQAATPKRVLYVDGEMPAITMQERLAALMSGMAPPPYVLQNLTIVTPDVQPMPMPDLSTTAGQAALEPLLCGKDMLILDNISTLCRTGKENESQSWQLMQSWLLDLRRRGLTVLLIHHAGKSGDQRGTSAREDIMDTVINLRRPKQYSMAEGARFEVHLTKARGLTGEDAEPFEAHLQTEDSILHWAIHSLEDVRLVELQKLLEEGYSIRDAADEMGISKSAAARLKKKLEVSA